MTCDHPADQACRRPKGSLRQRLRLALHVLRGQPLIYRAEMLDAQLGIAPAGEKPVAVFCIFHVSDPTHDMIRFFASPDTVADDQLRQNPIPDTPEGLT